MANHPERLNPEVRVIRALGDVLKEMRQDEKDIATMRELLRRALAGSPAEYSDECSVCEEDLQRDGTDLVPGSCGTADCWAARTKLLFDEKGWSIWREGQPA